MKHILLLTNFHHFTIIAAQLSCPWDIDFAYQILSDVSTGEKHINKQDYKTILETCRHRDLIILHIEGNTAIYLISMLLNDKRLCNSHIAVIQSPLLDFYAKPTKDSFVNQAIQEKLIREYRPYTLIRPFLFKAFFDHHLPQLQDESFQSLLISEVTFFNELLTMAKHGTEQNNVIYFFSNKLADHSATLLSVLNKQLTFFPVLKPFMTKLFQNTAYYNRLIQLDAVREFLLQIDSLPHKILIPAGTKQFITNKSKSKHSITT